eukprot:1036270-Prymnesium_polylepis.1
MVAVGAGASTSTKSGSAKVVVEKGMRSEPRPSSSSHATRWCTGRARQRAAVLRSASCAASANFEDDAMSSL